jgi:hypothetical protein
VSYISLCKGWVRIILHAHAGCTVAVTASKQIASACNTAATMVSRRRLDDFTDRIRDLKSLLYY